MRGSTKFPHWAHHCLLKFVSNKSKQFIHYYKQLKSTNHICLQTNVFNIKMTHLYTQLSNTACMCVFGCCPASHLILSLTLFLSSPSFMAVLHGLCPSLALHTLQRGQQMEEIVQLQYVAAGTMFFFVVFFCTINEILQRKTTCGREG